MDRIEPRFTREALFAQLHTDLDDLLGRIESLPEKVSKIETSMQATTAALTAGGEKYRAAVTAMNEEARTNLKQYMRLEAGTKLLIVIQPPPEVDPSLQ